MKQGQTLAERIIYALESQNKTQADLARETGLSTAIISQITSGKTKDPRLSNIIAIADALNVPVDYLAGKISYHVIRIDK